MATIKTFSGTKNHKVVMRKEWLTARKKLLVKEKKYSRLGDELAKDRRALPWVKVDKEYRFEGPNGTETLADLFGKNSQLIIYHFMFAPAWEWGCAHCSFWADHYDATRPHLNQRDTTLVVISRAPLAKLEAHKKRMGWTFKWVSSGKTDFNYDYGASFTPDQLKRHTAVYNYAPLDMDISDREGASVFFKDPRGDIYHTYSAYARGIDILNGTYHFLDWTAKGRDEDPDDTQSWVDFKDQYKNSHDLSTVLA